MIEGYTDCINTPDEQGSNTQAKKVQHNMNIFFSYIDFLISGKSSANKCKGVPGSQYFKKTNSTCMDGSTSRDKYNYYNFKPLGKMGKTASLPGRKSGNQGLIMGVLESLNNVSPTKMLNNVKNADSSKCVSIQAPITIKEDGTKVNSRNSCVYETHYIDESNAAMIDPCMIKGLTNPYRTSNKTCPPNVNTKDICKVKIYSSESFSNYNNNDNNSDNYNINNQYSYYNNKENDILVDLFYTGFSLSIIYLLYLYLKKEKAI